MLTILEEIRTEAEKLWQAGIHEAETILKKAEEAIDRYTTAKYQPGPSVAEPSVPGIEVTETAAEGVQVITGSADASAEIPAGYAPIASADPAPAEPAPTA